MKTLNIYYKDESLLVDFINLNKINNNSEILVQIFTLSSDLSFIKKLQNIINKHIKNAKVIGTSSDGIFGEESLKESSTLISISIFEKTKINTKIIKDENNNSFFIKSLQTK